MNFRQLESEVSFLAPPICADLFTLYQARSDAFIKRGARKDPADWGMTCVYRFDRNVDPIFIPRIVALAFELRDQIERLGMSRKVRLVTYYEVGADYLVQAKAPYDGGYSTQRFGTFVSHGDECKPPPGFVTAWAELVDVLVERGDMIAAGTPKRTDLLKAVVHKNLIRPNSEFFWDDEAETPWGLYRPSIESEELEAMGEV